MNTKLRPLPNFLSRLSTDEYVAPPLSASDLRARAVAGERMAAAGAPAGFRAAMRQSTAAGLLALNGEWGERFYALPDEAVDDEEAAREAFAPNCPVLDVQTHLLAPHAQKYGVPEMLHGLFRPLLPDWWEELRPDMRYTLSDYVSKVFLEAENAVVVLTSGPGLDDSRHLFNDELAATRGLVDTLAGPGRQLNHSVVHATEPGDLEAMPYWRDTYGTVGWKVYTIHGTSPDGGPAHGWMLDDERFGLPFLEHVRKVGPKLICAHKGISALADNGSPRDIGPAARAFPDIAFLVYHSGYEFPFSGPPEGPYSDETAHLGVNRLISSARQAGLGPGCNIYPELGTTWFCLIRRPIEAAHVLGKLIQAFGEDNLVWGTDGIFYGCPQPLVDAFRVFQIPEWMCERYGYAPLTPQVKRKILGENAARLYGVDLAAAERSRAADRLDWAVNLLDELKTRPFEALR